MESILKAEGKPLQLPKTSNSNSKRDELIRGRVSISGKGEFSYGREGKREGVTKSSVDVTRLEGAHCAL